jgi:hypothetical protein
VEPQESFYSSCSASSTSSKSLRTPSPTITHARIGPISRSHSDHSGNCSISKPLDLLKMKRKSTKPDIHIASDCSLLRSWIVTPPTPPLSAAELVNTSKDNLSDEEDLRSDCTDGSLVSDAYSMDKKEGFASERYKRTNGVRTSCLGNDDDDADTLSAGQSDARFSSYGRYRALRRQSLSAPSLRHLPVRGFSSLLLLPPPSSSSRPSSASLSPPGDDQSLLSCPSTPPVLHKHRSFNSSYDDGFRNGQPTAKRCRSPYKFVRSISTSWAVGIMHNYSRGSTVGVV